MPDNFLSPFYAAPFLSSQVYGLTDCPDVPPPGYAYLRIGSTNKPLYFHDAATGNYAAAFVRLRYDENQKPLLNHNGNPVPADIIIAYRGTVFSRTPDRFHPTAPDGFDLARHAPGDFLKTVTNLWSLITGKPAASVASVTRIDTALKKAILTEFSGPSASQQRRFMNEVPWTNTGHSQGGVNAILATALSLKNQGWSSHAILINTPPCGPPLEKAGLYDPKLQSDLVTDVHTTNDALMRHPVARFLQKLFGKTQATPLNVGRSLTLEPTTDLKLEGGFLQGHDPVDVIAGMISKARSEDPKLHLLLEAAAHHAFAASGWPPTLVNSKTYSVRLAAGAADTSLPAVTAPVKPSSPRNG